MIDIEQTILVDSWVEIDAGRPISHSERRKAAKMIADITKDAVFIKAEGAALVQVDRSEVQLYVVKEDNIIRWKFTCTLPTTNQIPEKD